MSLGDYFPDAYRDDFLKNKIKAGTVIRLFDTTTIPPKKKFFIISAVCQEGISVATVFINTEINPNMFPTASLRALHFELHKISNDFLTYDSFVDCSKLTDRNFDWLHGQITNDPSIVVGEVNETVIGTMHAIITYAPTISIKQKRKYGFA